MKGRNMEEDEEEDVGWKKQVMSLGQHGGLGGNEWDDGVFPWIKQVKIAYDSLRILSIVTEYCDDNGKPTWSDKHGGNFKQGTLSKVVVLEYPNEYLISIHGYMNKDGEGHFLIGSLTLESNKKSHGPFGEKKGTRFWFPTTGAKVIGFHGRSGWYLDSIGIKVAPIHMNTKISSSEG